MDRKKKILIIQIISFIVIVIGIYMAYNYFTYHKVNDDIAKKEEGESKMSVLKITNKNFEEEVLNSDKPVIIDFYADWCGPCKMMSPIIDSIAEEIEDVKVGKVNVDEEQDLAMKYNVMSIPTIIVFKNGEVYKEFIGVTEKQEILNAVK